MHPNAELISAFYSAFAVRDHETMARAYAETATFSDPVFLLLEASQVRAMWRMFCTSGNDIDVTFGAVVADDERGSAHWDAVYRFPRTGRVVHNSIDASFTFAGGRIVRHVDDFDLYRWTRMALGPLGAALGWTPLVRGRVRAQAGAQLKRFQANEAAP